MKNFIDSQDVKKVIAQGFCEATRLIVSSRKYYRENWKEDVDRGIVKAKTIWNEKVGIDINWNLILALVFLPALIKYCFEFWCALLMFVAVVYVYCKMSEMVKGRQMG